MKKFPAIIIILALILSLTACASPALSEKEPPESPSAEGSPSPEPPGILASFSAVDLEGNAVDESILSEHSLTMLNVWGTYCGPCIREMPDLASLSDDYADKGLRVVGLLVDVSSPDKADAAWRIIEQTGADYLHLLPSDDLNAAVLSGIYAVPTTLFFDSEGKQVGDAYVGSRSFDAWAAIADGLLEGLAA